DEIIELVNVVQDNLSGAEADEDGEIIELVDKIDVSQVLLEKETLPLEPQHISLTGEPPPLSSETEPLLSSEEHITALLEKVIENRYGAQLDAMFSQVMENILNRQMDDIKKKILTALQ
ncbi:MAG: hypothetical protein HQK73_03210, partial [Desulfamplus sp.]|nr:hypothetical protein [Desulfamplus sp.]